MEKRGEGGGWRGRLQSFIAIYSHIVINYLVSAVVFSTACHLSIAVVAAGAMQRSLFSSVANNSRMQNARMPSLVSEKQLY